MTKKRIISLVLCLVLIISALPIGVFSAEDRNKRAVYLHADGINPLETKIASTVYMGDTANIYVAVDTPNKGGENHLYPQYDMNGYTVRIYYDDYYFDFLGDELSPIVYDEPGKKTEGGTGTGTDNITPGTTPDDVLGGGGNLPGGIGYYVYRHGMGNKVVNGKEYCSAYITVFFSGDFLPDEEEPERWYNLCKLPLVPERTGSTQVLIDTSDDAANYSLELFAKNTSGDINDQTFEWTAVNGGRHTINIRDKSKPAPPVPDVLPGSYTTTKTVSLTAEEDCKIVYSVNGGAERDYTGPIEVETTTDITCYAQRTTGAAKKSDTVTYTYRIIPEEPHLFVDNNGQKEHIPFIYTPEGGSYEVFASNTATYSGIDGEIPIYYTFKTDLSTDFITPDGGTDPEKEWVKLTNQVPKFNIDQKRTVKLVAKKADEVSEIVWYYLSVKPGAVKATPGSGIDKTQPISLHCDMPLAEIYYTLNGDDPRDGGEKYTSPITLSGDTIVKAVAKYGEQWGEVSSFWYIFTSKSGVTAFHPSGVYTGSVDVTLYPNEPGKQIEISYTGDIDDWHIYDGKTMVIEGYTKFRARIKGDNSLGDEFVYIIKPNPPVFSPEECQFTSSDTVTVYCPDKDKPGVRYELWCSTDGEPTAEDKVDGGVAQIKIVDETTIQAVVVKYVNGEMFKSDLVVNHYSVVYGKPARPFTTLPTGYYTRETGSSEFSTKFERVPDTDVYYTISTGVNQGVSPDITSAGDGITFKYDGEDIEVIDTMIITAVAVKNIGGKLTKSDQASFTYNIVPEAPRAASSANVSELPLVEVEALTVESDGSGRCKIIYSIGDGVNSFDGHFINDYTNEADKEKFSKFYIDTKTGNAYRDKEKTQLLYRLDKNFSNIAMLVLSAELDGVSSEQRPYVYAVESGSSLLVSPFADKESGKYLESGNDFVVTLSSIYKDTDNAKIQWKFSEDAQWTDYNPETKVTFPTADKILYIRTVTKTGEPKESQCVGYVYYFYPPAPTITPASGTYMAEDNTPVSIRRADFMTGQIYRLYYNQSTEKNDWGSGFGNFEMYQIDSSKTIRAYIENTVTGRISEVVYEKYIALDEGGVGGAVSILPPFDSRRISAHKLGKGEYAKGVLFRPDYNVIYNYEYTFVDGGGYTSDNIIFNKNNAFIPTERMDIITINAWIDGQQQSTQIPPHTIDIIHLNVPQCEINAQPDSSGNYAVGSTFTIKNEYSTDKHIIVYYTLDGSDPETSTNRKSFTLEESKTETLEKSTTVKARYFSACGGERCGSCQNGDYSKCPNYVFGDLGVWKYNTPTNITVTTGGGGGGGVKPVQKYTKDFFGREHPTHIGYIKGYPDGTVKPEGNITREEVAAVLYRICDKSFDSPHSVTGEVFPDVEKNRWSAYEIEYMADKEVIVGYPDGNFEPAKNITRAEFAALIARLIDETSYKGENKFADLEEEHWAYEYIMSLAKNGLIEGYEDGTYRADSFITRAEAMTIINKLLGRKPYEPYVKSLDFNPYSDLDIEKWYYVIVLEATITHDYTLNSSGYEIKWEDCK